MMFAGELLKFEWCLWYGLNSERIVLVLFLEVIEVLKVIKLNVLDLLVSVPTGKATRSSC